MNPLVDFVVAHTEPGPAGAVDMYFMKVSKKGDPTAEEFVRLTKEHQGAFCDLDPLVGEHSYINLGGWIGDQGLALRYMALGETLKLWKVMQPKMILDVADPQDKVLADRMAGVGLVSILPA